ncbi:uncharacterized protein CLUP02_10650 [Colletotrichum lupini]|uniref:Uncharacterized protein n=1 Tax=Colletotrichum lupini TaxID=145971 RepID=A0A9Q8SWZ4_9PEZI|nr:uncharacterized protein CLUP02_10650 [Colletotrichum lupini]UQC85154.1 hypothetical protein CLUP02_10650 [Colletotrichum lupini]
MGLLTIRSIVDEAAGDVSSYAPLASKPLSRKTESPKRVSDWGSPKSAVAGREGEVSRCVGFSMSFPGLVHRLPRGRDVFGGTRWCEAAVCYVLSAMWCVQ